MVYGLAYFPCLLLPSNTYTLYLYGIFFYLAALGLSCSRQIFTASCGIFFAAVHALYGALAQNLWCANLGPLQNVGFSSLTRDRTCIPCMARQILNHWTTRGVPFKNIFDIKNFGDEGVKR